MESESQISSQRLVSFFKEVFDLRESAAPRIGTGVLITTFGGFYTGTVMLSKATMDPYIAPENVHRLTRVRHLYTVRAF